MFYDLFVFHKLESIAPTTVKLGDESTANCTQIGEVVLHMSDGRRLRLSQVLYVPLLAINLLSVSQLAKKGIMCCALLKMRPLSIPCAECSVVISCGKSIMTNLASEAMNARCGDYV
jgi:hypothetical protein